MSGNAQLDPTAFDQKVVWDVIDQAARRVSRKYARYVEFDDMRNEAAILVGTKADLLECVHDEEKIGLLQYRLEMDLIDLCRTIATRADRQVSYDSLMEAAGTGEGFILPYVAIETASNDYTRESVESLLPAVWDETYTYGLPKRDTAPDPDMPKGSANKSHGNTLSAYIADIKTGWEKTALTHKERCALLLAFGFGWTHQEIAFNQNCHKTTITHRIENAIGKIVNRLNGGVWAELEGVEA